MAITSNGVQYEIAGSGPGLLMVHGTGGDLVTNFAHLVPGFSDVRTVITPNYAGSGESADPGGDLSLDLLADQVVDPVDGSFDLVGFSLGALVAASVAAKHPERVRKLVLIAGWTHAEDPRLRFGLETWARHIDAKPAVGPLLAFSPAFLSGLGEEGLRAMVHGDGPPGTLRQIELDLRADIRDRLPLITAPTLVIGNTQDHLIPVEHARALHAALPGSRYAELDSGHVVVHERPAELTRLIRDFLLE